MNSTLRRFEMLLPLQFNDGRDIPPETVADAVQDVVDNLDLLAITTMLSRGAGLIKESSIAIKFQN